MGDQVDLPLIQSEANNAVGARRLPAREVPSPSGLDAGHRALIEAPYSPAWNLAPVSDDDWRALQSGMLDRVAPVLARVRDDLAVSMELTSVGGVDAYRLSPQELPDAHRDQLVFSLHGGGYVLGRGESGTGEATLLAAYGGYRVLCLDYGLAPDRPHPAALEDALAAWKAIVDIEDPKRIAIGGVSAGAGLAMALLIAIGQEGLPMPAAVSLGTPWADMTRTGDSYAANEWLDNVLVSYDGYLARAARRYANGRDLADPALSPIYGDLSAFPPTILLSGTRDLFLSNTVRTHRKLRDSGVEAELHVFEGLSHAQFALTPGASVTLAACREITTFFDRHLARGDG